MDQDAPKEPADQTEASSGKGGTRENTSGDADAEVGPSEESAIASTSDDVAASSEAARETSRLGSDLDETGNAKGFPPDETAAAAGLCSSAREAQSHILPRSLSVSAVTSQSLLLHFDLAEADQVVSCQSKVCKEITIHNEI